MSDEREQEENDLPANRDVLSRRARDDAAAPEPRDAGPSSLWEGLLAGHFSLVEQFEREGHTYLVARRNEPCGPKLSPREREVVALAARSLTNAQIALRIGLSPALVAAHLANAGQKMGISSREELVRAAEAFAADADPMLG